MTYVQDPVLGAPVLSGQIVQPGPGMTQQQMMQMQPNQMGMQGQMQGNGDDQMQQMQYNQYGWQQPQQQFVAAPQVEEVKEDVSPPVPEGEVKPPTPVKREASK